MKLRDKILNCQDIQKEFVEVKEWDVTVEVRGMSGKQRAEMTEAAYNPKDQTVTFAKVYSRIMIETVYDKDTGEKIFNIGDEDMLNNKSGAALEKVVSVAMRLSGLGGDEQAEISKN